MLSPQKYTPVYITHTLCLIPEKQFIMGGNGSSHPGPLPAVAGSLGTNTGTGESQGQSNNQQGFPHRERHEAEPAAVPPPLLPCLCPVSVALITGLQELVVNEHSHLNSACKFFLLTPTTSLPERGQLPAATQNTSLPAAPHPGTRADTVVLSCCTPVTVPYEHTTGQPSKLTPRVRLLCSNWTPPL